MDTSEPSIKRPVNAVQSRDSVKRPFGKRKRTGRVVRSGYEREVWRGPAAGEPRRVRYDFGDLPVFRYLRHDCDLAGRPGIPAKKFILLVAPKMVLCFCSSFGHCVRTMK